MLFLASMQVIERESGENCSFQVAAGSALTNLKSALLEVVQSLALPSTRPNDFCQELGLDKSLASKIARLLEAPDPFDMVACLPGRAALRIFLRAAERNGLSTSQHNAVLDALDQFERVGKHYAGDRTTFNIMLNACADTNDTPAAVAQRRSAFRANSYLFGIQAKAQYKLAVVAPSSVAGLIDLARIHGFVRMRRMRPDVAWTLSRSLVVSDKGAPRTERPVRRPLSSDSLESGSALLREFSSSRLPRTCASEMGDGATEERILPGPVGNTGAFTLFSGDIVEAVGPARFDADNRIAGSVARMHTPVELLVFDYFVHGSTIGESTPEFALYHELGGAAWPACGESKRLPLSFPVRSLGKGFQRTHHLDVPKCTNLIRFVFEKTGWRPEEFHGYRVCVTYPPIPTSAVLRYELQPRE